MSKNLNNEEQSKKIYHAYASARALGWFLIAGALVIGGIVLYFDAPLFFLVVLTPNLLIGPYFVYAGRKIATYQEDFEQARKANKTLLVVSYILLAISILLIAAGGAGTLVTLLMGILVFYVHRAKNVFNEIKNKANAS